MTLEITCLTRRIPLLLCLVHLLGWVGHAQASFLGDVAGEEIQSADLPTGKESVTWALPFQTADQLERIGVDDRFFFDPAEGETPGSAEVFDVETHGGGGRALRSLYRFERGIGFDRGTPFDRDQQPKEKSNDQGEDVDRAERLDSPGDFDLKVQAVIQPPKEAPRGLPSFRREESPLTSSKESDRRESITRGEGRVEPPSKREESFDDALSRERDNLEQELLKSEERALRYFKPTRSALFLKMAIFFLILLLLLAATLRGLIPLRFYFFLTLLVVILWNPTESLFISIIIALSAFLSPLLG